MSNFQDRFSFSRILTLGGIAFLLLGLFVSSSAQADLIYAVRVNALNAKGTYNYRTDSDAYSNYYFSTNDDSTTGQWVTQANKTSDSNSTYNNTPDTVPIMLCDLGTVRTINAIHLAQYSAGGNNVKAMKVEFYDSPAINATPVYTQTFTDIPRSLTNLSLTTPTDARFVKITMTENHGGDRYGVGNIMFDVASTGKPTSSSANVTTYTDWTVSNLFDSNTNTQWATDVSTGGGYYNPEVGNPTPVLTFNYDTPQTITGIGVNPYSVAGNSLKEFNLKFYDASGAEISVADPTQYSLSMTQYKRSVREDFTFPAVENVSKIEMTITSNFITEAGSAGDRVGLSEVSFFVPVELDAPTKPVVYNGRYSTDSTLVRPTSAQFLTKASSNASARALTYLYDGTESSPGGNEWYTTDIKIKGKDENNNTVDKLIPDYYIVGFTPTIEFTMEEEAVYDSFSIWGYNSKGNLMSDFTLELFDSNGNLVYADEYLIDTHIDKSHYATFSFGGDSYAFKTAVLTALDNGYNFYPNAGGGDRVGFTEIAFYQVEQAPYYYANTSDINAANWTIDGSNRLGVIFTEGGQTATFANPVILNAYGSSFEIGEKKNLTLSGVVSGYGSLTKTGKGTLTLTKANSYENGTTISEGTVKLTEAGTLGSGYVYLDESATLEFAHETEQTFSNYFDGAGSVKKTGSGTLKLNNALYYSGETTVSKGTLFVPNGINMSTSKVTVESGAAFQTGGGVNGEVEIQANAALTIGESDQYSSVSFGSLTLDGGTINFDIFNSDNFYYDFDSIYVGSAKLKSGIINLTFNGSSADAWRDVIGNTDLLPDGLKLIGGNILDENFNASNSLQVYVDGSLSTDWKLSAVYDDWQPGLYLTINGSGPDPGDDYWYYANTIDIEASSWSIDGTNKLGAVLTEGNNPSVTYYNPVQMSGNGIIQVGRNYNLTLSGGLSGSGALEKTDEGKLTITTANSGFTGDTTVSGGTLELTGAGTLGSTTINVGAGATMLYNNTVPHNESALTFNINGGTLEFYNTTPATTHNADNGICTGQTGQDVVINGTNATLLIDGGGTISAIADTGNSGVTFNLDSNSVFDVRSGMFINGSWQAQHWENNQATLHIGATGKVDLWDGSQMKVGGLTGEAGAKIVNDSGKKSCKGISIGNGVTADKTFTYNGSITLDNKAVDYVGEGTQIINGTVSGATIQSNNGTLVLNGALTGDTIQCNSGTLNLNGSVSSSSKVYSKGGTLVLGTTGTELNIGGRSLVRTDGGAIRVDGNIVVNTVYMSAGGDWTGNGSITVNNGGTLRINGTFNFAKGITLNGGTLFNDGDSDSNANGKSVVNAKVTVISGNVQSGWNKNKSGELTLAGGLYGNGNLTINSDSDMGWINITGTGDYGGSLTVKGRFRIGGTGKNIGTSENPASVAPYIGSKEIQMNGGIIHNYDAYLLFPNDLNMVSDSNIMAGWSKDITLSGNIKGSGAVVISPDSGWVIAKTKSDGSFTGAVQTNWSSDKLGNLRLGAAQPFGPNAGLGAIEGQLDMNGYSQVFKGITSSVDTSTQTQIQKGTIFNNTNTLSTLTLNISGADNSYEGVINGNIELIVNSTGAGKQTFNNNASTFTGNIVINGGTVNVPVSHSGYTTTALGAFSTTAGRSITINAGGELELGTNDAIGGCGVSSNYNENSVRLIVNGGKLSGTKNNPLYNATFQNGAEVYGANNQDIYRSFWLMGTNKVTFAGNGSTPESPVTFNGAEGVIFVLDSAELNVDDITKSSAADLVVNVKLGNKSESVVTNNSLTKTGAGTVRLTKVNEFTGPTTISAGALALASSGSLATDVTVAAGASFIDAAPTITSNVTLNGGSLVIGETTDSAQIAIGDLTVYDGSILFDFNDSSSSTDYDRLTAASMTFTTAAINVTFNNGDQTSWWNNTDNGYVLIDTSSLNGSVDNLQLLVNSATTDAWYLDTVGTSIVLKKQNVEPPVTDIYYRANSSEDITDEKWTIDGANKQGVTLTAGDSATATFAGEVEMNANGSFEVAENKNLKVTGPVTGEGEVEKKGDGTLTLSGNNTYTGKTTVTDGTLALTGDAIEANNSSIEITGDAVLEYNVPSGNKRLNFTESGTTVTGGKVIKTGAGKLLIRTGEANAPQFSATDFTVKKGELDFLGAYYGNLEVERGATLSPGNSAGDLTVYGNVKIDAGATGLFEFSAYDPDNLEYDRLFIGDNQSFMLEGLIKLDFGSYANANDWATAENPVYQIVYDENFYTDSDSINLNEYLTGDYKDFFDLQGTSAGLFLIGRADIPIPEPGTGVPEPSTWALLILGAAGLLYWHKKNA